MTPDEHLLITEPSWWCRTTASRRARELSPTTSPSDRVVVAQLSGRPTRTGSAEDRTCDRCRTYVPPGALFWCAIYMHRGFRFVLGLCTDCARRESPEWVATGQGVVA